MNARRLIALLLWAGAAGADGMGGAAIDRLVDGNPVVRRAAAETLGERPDSAALAGLIAALNDPDAEVRRKVASALGAYREPLAVAALIKALENQDSTVQWAVAEALGRMGEAALLPLVEASSRGSAAQRRGAVRALGKLSDHAPVLQALTHALIDEEAGVRAEAAHALAGWRDGRVVEPLAAALGDFDPGVQGQAARTLAQLRDVRAIAPLIGALRDSEPGLRATLSEALAELGPDAVTPLIAALGDEDASVQAGALSALARLGSAAVWPLIAELGRAAPERQENLLEALDAVGSASHRPLREATRDPDPILRTGAALALGRLAGHDAIRSLHPLLNDGDERVREAAGESLQRLEALHASGEACC